MFVPEGSGVLRTSPTMPLAARAAGDLSASAHKAVCVLSSSAVALFDVALGSTSVPVAANPSVRSLCTVCDGPPPA